MKNYIYKLPILLLAITFLWACEKDLDTEDVSRITTFADLKLKGDDLTILKVGQPYTEQGATATESGQTVNVAISGEVDTDAPGIYVVEYVATNKDKFPTTLERVVAVLPATLPAEVLSTDLTGTYQRVGNNQIVNIVKLADGLYQVDNFGGVVPPSSAIFPAYLIHQSATQLVIPEQPSPSGPVSGTDGKVAGESVAWKVINPGFGTATRTFVKVKPPKIRYE